MASPDSINQNASAGIHVDQARDVTLRAGGDIVAGDKTTIHNYYGPKPQDITKAPYKFLSYYDIGDRDIFFGRDAVIEDLAGEIPRHKVLIINGQSGSGKTSLINAGLIPRLAENGYLYVYFRDYTNPMEQLREYFRDHPDFALPDADKLSLLQILRTIRSQQESPVVVIFDQFERFLINVAADPRREFLQQLRECLESDLTADELNLVISLRDDFFGKLLLEAEAIIPTFGTDSHHHNLRTLNRDEARQAIIQPLKNIRNIGFDSKFVDDVLLPHLMGQATGEAKIEPPHLQIVCNQLYEAARDRNRRQLEDGEPVRIGFDLYHDLGETEGMLRDYLDDVVRRITNADPKQIAIVRSTLKLMIETVGTRKFEALDDISANLPDVPRGETERIIERLQEARVLEPKHSGDETEYSLSHEFMVAKVQSWYDERELERRRAQETLERGLKEWQSNKTVFDATQVTLLQKWLPNEAVSDTAQQLIRASTRRYQRQRWLKRGFFAAIFLCAGLLPLVLYFWIIATRETEKAERQLVETKESFARQLTSRGAAEILDGHPRNGVTSLQQAYKTLTSEPQDDESERLRNRICGIAGSLSARLPRYIVPDDLFTCLAASPDGRLIATASVSGSIQRWDVESATKFGGPLKTNCSPIRKLALDSSGEVVAFSGHLGDMSDKWPVEFWDFASGQKIKTEPLLTSRRAPFEFIPESHLFVTLDSGPVYFDINMKSPEQSRCYRPPNHDSIGKTTWDGNSFGFVRKTNGGHEYLVWDSELFQKEPRKTSFAVEPDAIATSHSGTWALVEAKFGDKTMLAVKNSESGDPVPLEIPRALYGGTLQGKWFSADGSKLAARHSFSRDNLITPFIVTKTTVWGTDDGKVIQQPLVHQFHVSDEDVAFSRDSQRLATMSSDLTFSVTEFSGSRPRTQRIRPLSESSVLAVPLGDERFAFLSYDFLFLKNDLIVMWNGEEACVWRLEAPSRVVPRKSEADGTGGDLLFAAISPKKSGPKGEESPTTVAVLEGGVIGQGRPTIMEGKSEWADVIEQMRTAKIESWDEEGLISSIAFHPTRQEVVTGGSRGVAVWKLGAQEPELHPLGMRAFYVAYSSDGKRILAVTGLNSGSGLASWNTKSGMLEWLEWSEFFGGAEFQAVAGFQDLVVTASSERAQVWKIKSEKKLWENQRGEEEWKVNLSLVRQGPAVRHGAPLFSVCFSPDGDSIVTGGKDGVVRVWDWQTGIEIAAPRYHDSAVMSVEFTADGELFAATRSGQLCYWPVYPSAPTDPDAFRAWCDLRTGGR